MKKSIIIYILSALIFVPNVQAQRLHKILFGHTTDSKIGESVSIDICRASNEIDNIGAYLDYEVVSYIKCGNDCSREQLENVLKNLQVSSQDIVVFYYSGHGGHAKKGLDDPWPQMCLNRPELQEKYYPLRKVIETIKQKNPHFALILSDCCNAIDETGYVTVKSVLKGMNGATDIEEQTKRNYKTLFTEYTGILPITSSKLSQVSYGDNEDGGYFSLNFFEALYNNVQKTSSAPTWNEIVEETKQGTLRLSGGDQEPSFDLSSITHHEQTNVVPIPPVNPDPNPIATTSKLEIAITQLLKMPDSANRLAYVQTILRDNFASNNVTVLTLGRNLTTVVDNETAQTFLRRIAQNPKIQKINIINEQSDNTGRCSYLTVHEVRK